VSAGININITLTTLTPIGETLATLGPANKKRSQRAVSVFVSASVSNCDAELVSVNPLGYSLRWRHATIGSKGLRDASSSKRHTRGGGISPYRAASDI